MSATGNLLLCPTFKIEDRRAIVRRVLDALLADPECRYTFGRSEWKQLTPDEEGNWIARQHFTTVSLSYRESDPEPHL
jgi:hypothetical protein